MWCTLVALAGTPIWDAAARCLISTQAFIKPMSALADAKMHHAMGPPLEFRTGVAKSVSLVGRPLLDMESSPSLWSAMSKTLEADGLLRNALLSSANAELESWIAALRPTPVHEIPHSLLTSLADFSDVRLDRVELPTVRPPAELPWVPLPPR